MMYRTVLVDDEPPALRRLRELLGAHPEIAVIGEAGSGSEAVRRIQEDRPDLVFLDIDLPDYDGFAVLRRVDDPPLVIFVTGYDQYALQAFEAAGIDYLLKPLDSAALNRALAKLKRLTQSGRSEFEANLRELLERWKPTPTVMEYLRKMAVRIGERALLVDVSDVSHFNAKDKYVFLHTAVGKEYIVDQTVAELETRLDPRKFVRVHRSTIVNIDRIREIQTWFCGKYRLVLDDRAGSELVVSKGMAPKLKALVPF